jgi:hypothetical protein
VRPPGATGAGFRVISDPANKSVVAWSVTRLPFNPGGAMVDFRDAIREEVWRLQAGPTDALRATYVSPVTGAFDVENVLLYNVGPARFAGSAGRELIIERRLANLPSIPGDLPDAAHQHRYEIVEAGAPWQFWTTTRNVASFESAGLANGSASLRDLAQIWWAVRSGRVDTSAGTADRSPLALHVVVQAAPGTAVNLAAVAKPIIDGIISSFHSHLDRGSLAELSRRVAAKLGQSVTEVHSFLASNPSDVLGPRQLLWPWRDSVQWNPADDRCVAIRIQLESAAAARGTRAVSIRGALSEVQELH